MRKSKALTFFLSFVPGLGHYYLGLMNRGLQMMILFFGSIFLMDFIRLGAFPFFVPIIWFYSLFDALQRHRMIVEEQNVSDDPLFSWNKVQVQKHMIGWGLIVLGGYLLFDRITYLFGWQYYNLFKNLIIAIALILIGWYFISGKKLISPKKTKEVE